MIAVIGSGAFGTALAIAFAQAGRPVLLWARDTDHADQMAATRRNEKRLPGAALPDSIEITAIMPETAEAVLLAMPMQALARGLPGMAEALDGLPLVACCKGIDLATGRGATALIKDACPRSTAAVLTGPSFAADIARGLPTALTLACADDTAGDILQQLLSTLTLRIYRTTDVAGAEIGGALKNVIAIASGIVIGAGLGDSARAALMTRGYAEMVRAAQALGARAETLAGLSGLGDLVLTCTSDQSRNFRYGRALGMAQAFDPTVTVEGIATAQAMTKLALKHGLDLPITAMVGALTTGQIGLQQAIQALMSRPLKQE
jgi:glycerol-3-phosphate dehydrogenase (NAD(P)+)